MTNRSMVTTNVSVNNLTMVYGGRTVLDIPSFEVKSGEVMAIIGPNGSGKTTLLFNLALLTTPTTGTISYSNVPVKTGYQMLQVRRRIATVFQEHFSLLILFPSYRLFLLMFPSYSTPLIVLVVAHRGWRLSRDQHSLKSAHS